MRRTGRQVVGQACMMRVLAAMQPYGYDKRKTVDDIFARISAMSWGVGWGGGIVVRVGVHARQTALFRDFSSQSK